MRLFDPADHPGTKSPLVHPNRRALDVRDPRCCVPLRYGEPCEERDTRGPVRACKHCDRPM